MPQTIIYKGEILSFWLELNVKTTAINLLEENVGENL